MFNIKFIAMKSKPTLLILLLLFTLKFNFAVAAEELPLEPWRAIVFMEKFQPDTRWEKDITIKLYGSYTPEDSIMIQNSIHVLNDLCETVQLSFSLHDRGNLEIFFLDSINENIYESIIEQPKESSSYSKISYNYTQTNGIWSADTIKHCDLSFRFALVLENSRQNYLTNNLAYLLYPKNLDISYIYKNGREVFTQPISIFFKRSIEKGKKQWIAYEQPYHLELSQFDRQLIKTVYASNFRDLLPKAKKQYNPIPSWFRDHSQIIMIFPLVLVLFLFTGLFLLLYKKLLIKIQNRLLQFNVISAIALLTFGILNSLYYVAAEKIRDPYFSFFDILDITGVIVIILILGLPAFNVIRLIELAIHRKTRYKYFKVLLAFLSTSLIPSITCFAIYYFSPIKEHSGKTGVNVLSILFLVFIILAVLRALISFFILKENELKIENEMKLSALRELKSKAELNALHSRINPHFLYNSLNSIAGLAHDDADKTEHMALSLSKLFRYSINKDQSDWTTFQEELEMVKIYLDVEKVRFDDRLTYLVELPSALEDYKIPRFIIQPLVENAVKHGISKSVGEGLIRVAVTQDDETILISVYDNGPDFPNDLAPGFGIQSIYDKLEILYKNRFELKFINSPQKQVLIRLN
jgi:sensor histidine kinase YesM